MRKTLSCIPVRKKTCAALLSVILCAALSPLASCSDEYQRSLLRSSNAGQAAALNETARFIAAMDLAEGAKLYPATRDKAYQVYREQVNLIWERFRSSNLQEIEKWRDARLPRTYSDTVFYPFSGPDIVNALAFFPSAGEYIMFGLETPGDLPDPVSLPAPKVAPGLWGMKHALRTILLLNLFRTGEMKADMRNDSFNSITGVMLFFLARYDYEILGVRKVGVAGDGRMKAGTSAEEADIGGVEITFRKKAGEGGENRLQRALYFRIDASDASLKAKPHFISFLEGRGRYTTILKSASYLLSYDTFDTVRGLVLRRSDFILQDDSGIPYRYFPEKEWRLSLYGYYRVLEMFAKRFQPDLNEAMKKSPTVYLPFRYGYGFTAKKSNLLFAERIR